MRLRAQTTKIEGGFILLPKEASWLNAYIFELISFPNSKNDDQVDSTVFALAWLGQRSGYGWTDEGVEALERIVSHELLMRRFGRPY